MAKEKLFLKTIWNLERQTKCQSQHRNTVDEEGSHPTLGIEALQDHRTEIGVLTLLKGCGIPLLNAHDS